jgi:hypothetical protein
MPASETTASTSASLCRSICSALSAVLLMRTTTSSRAVRTSQLSLVSPCLIGSIEKIASTSTPSTPAAISAGVMRLQADGMGATAWFCKACSRRQTT